MRYVIQTGTNPASSHTYLTTVLQQEYICGKEYIQPLMNIFRNEFSDKLTHPIQNRLAKWIFQPGWRPISTDTTDPLNNFSMQDISFIFTLTGEHILPICKWKCWTFIPLLRLVLYEKNSAVISTSIPKISLILMLTWDQYFVPILRHVNQM